MCVCCVQERLRFNKHVFLVSREEEVITQCQHEVLQDQLMGFHQRHPSQRSHEILHGISTGFHLAANKQNHELSSRREKEMRFGCADFKSPKSVAQSPKSWMEWLWSSGMDSKDRHHVRSETKSETRLFSCVWKPGKSCCYGVRHTAVLQAIWDYPVPSHSLAAGALTTAPWRCVLSHRMFWRCVLSSTLSSSEDVIKELSAHPARSKQTPVLA